jgi:eukaryotic translation initiation factor 2C
MYKSGPAPKVVHGNGHFPQPDFVVAKIEDDFIKKSKELKAALDNLSVTPAFPPRPAHGDAGQAVTLWANFFDVKPGPGLVYFKYSIEVTPVDKSPNPSKTRTKWILALLLEDEQDLHGVYTDSRSNLYSLEKLAKTPRIITISYRGQGEDAPPPIAATYRIVIKDTGTTLISEYLKYLKHAMTNSPQFPQRDDVLQTLNIVLGHHPHQRLDIATIGQNKHYPISPPVSHQLTGGLHAIRGIFTSVRPGTSRLLLNVNASHTVCHAEQLLSDLIQDTDLRNDLPRLSRRLRLIRVQRLHLPDRKNKAGKLIQYTSVVVDVARTTDGKEGANPPQVRCDGAGPKDVKFYLVVPSTQPAAKRFSGKTTGKSAGEAAGVGGRYISVWDYFTKSKLFLRRKK